MNKIQAVLKEIHTAVNDLEAEMKVCYLDYHIGKIKEKASALLALAEDAGDNLFDEERLFIEEINKRRKKYKIKPFTLTRMYENDGSVTLSIWNRRVGEFYIGVIRS